MTRRYLPAGSFRPGQIKQRAPPTPSERCRVCKTLIGCLWNKPEGWICTGCLDELEKNRGDGNED